jgi:hypothetical protein
MRVAILLGLFVLFPHDGYCKGRPPTLNGVLRKHGLQLKFSPGQSGDVVAELVGNFKRVEFRSDAKSGFLMTNYGHGATEAEAVANLVEKMRGTQMIVSRLTPKMAAKNQTAQYKLVDVSTNLRAPK